MPTFTTDWFSHYASTWREHVVPVISKIPRARWLEVGSFEGRSTLWTLDEVLTSPGSSVTCVDPWAHDSPKHCAAELNFDRNVAGRQNVTKLRGYSQDVLPTLQAKSYHGAYVDGSHELEDVRRDILLLLPLLVRGAVVVFDDYEGSVRGFWADHARKVPVTLRRFGVKEAVDELLARERPHVELLHVGWQLILVWRPSPARYL